MKIKKFKVPLYKREIVRNLRIANQEIKEVTPELDGLIESEIVNSNNYIVPSAIFGTFKEDTIIEKLGFSPDANMDFPELNLPKHNVVATTIVVITLGNSIESEIRQVEIDREKPLHSQLIRAIGLNAIDSGITFVNKIVKEDAEKDNCILSPIIKINTPGLLKKIVTFLAADKIAVTISDTGEILPVFTMIGMYNWYYSKKAKN